MKHKYEDFFPILAFVVALICKSSLMEAASVMMLAEIMILREKIEALEEAATSPKAE